MSRAWSFLPKKTYCTLVLSQGQWLRTTSTPWQSSILSRSTSQRPVLWQSAGPSYWPQALPTQKSNSGTWDRREAVLLSKITLSQSLAWKLEQLLTLTSPNTSQVAAWTHTSTSQRFRCRDCLSRWGIRAHRAWPPSASKTWTAHPKGDASWVLIWIGTYECGT